MTPKQTDFDGNDVDLPRIDESDEILMTNAERDYFKDSHFKPDEKCSRCDDSWLECYRSDKYRLDDARYSEKLEEMVCFYCYESETSYGNGTVIIFRPSWNEVEKWVQNDLEDVKYVASDMTVDELANLHENSFEFEGTDETCDIQFSYVKSDAWRGRNEAKAPDWTSLHTDGILGYSSDATELKNMNDEIIRHLWTANVDFAVVIGMTSNVFYQTYELMIEGPITADVASIMLLLRLKHRDERRYNLTALTGKSGDYDRKDDLLLEAYRRMTDGEDMTEIMTDFVNRGEIPPIAAEGF